MEFNFGYWIFRNEDNLIPPGQRVAFTPLLNAFWAGPWGLEGISAQFARKRTHPKNFKVYTAVQPMPGASGLPYYCTPSVCVPDVIGVLAVWRQNIKEKKCQVDNLDTLRIRSSVWFTMRTSHCREKNSVGRQSASVRIQLAELTFVENRDTLRIRSSVWFTTRTSHCRERLSGAQKCVCEGLIYWSHNVEDLDAHHVRSSVTAWFTTCTSHCQENSVVLKRASVRVQLTSLRASVA